GDGHGIHPRAGEPAHPLVLPRVGAGPFGRSRGTSSRHGQDGLMAGTATKPGKKNVDCRTAAVWRAWLRHMLLSGRFEEKAGDACSLGKIGGFCHLYIGQEAVAVGT